MTFITKICIGRGLSDDELVSKAEKLAEMAAKGIVVNDSAIEDMVFSRSWATLEAAQEWIDFVNTFDPPVVSATIVTE